MRWIMRGISLPDLLPLTLRDLQSAITLRSQRRKATTTRKPRLPKRSTVAVTLTKKITNLSICSCKRSARITVYLLPWYRKDIHHDHFIVQYLTSDCLSYYNPQNIFETIHKWITEEGKLKVTPRDNTKAHFSIYMSEVKEPRSIIPILVVYSRGYSPPDTTIVGWGWRMHDSYIKSLRAIKNCYSRTGEKLSTL